MAKMQEKGFERTQVILAVAQTLLAQQGYAGLSMRAVAQQVGISLGNLQHYYPSKEKLVEALLIHILDGFQLRVAEMTDRMQSASQFERFKALIDQVLIEIRQPDTYGLLAEINALANRLPFAAQLMQTVFERERKEVFKLINGLNPKISKEEYKRRAAMIVVQIHGLLAPLVPDGGRGFSRTELEKAAREAFSMLALIEG